MVHEKLCASVMVQIFVSRFVLPRVSFLRVLPRVNTHTYVRVLTHEAIQAGPRKAPRRKNHEHKAEREESYVLMYGAYVRYCT